MNNILNIALTQTINKNVSDAITQHLELYRDDLKNKSKGVGGMPSIAKDLIGVVASVSSDSLPATSDLLNIISESVVGTFRAVVDTANYANNTFTGVVSARESGHISFFNDNTQSINTDLVPLLSLSDNAQSKYNDNTKISVRESRELLDQTDVGNVANIVLIRACGLLDNF